MGFKQDNSPILSDQQIAPNTLPRSELTEPAKQSDPESHTHTKCTTFRSRPILVSECAAAAALTPQRPRTSRDPPATNQRPRRAARPSPPGRLCRSTARCSSGDQPDINNYDITALFTRVYLPADGVAVHTVRPGHAVYESIRVISRFLVLNFGPSWR